MKPAIVVDGIGKKYRVNHQAERGGYKTLRDSLSGMVAAPLRRLRNRGEEGRVEDFWALRDVSFEVKPGEAVGIIGRNGAGKSTLLKVLSQITKPSTGEMRLRGRVASLLEVGTGFHPELTGRENVFLNGSILGMHRWEIARKFDEIVDFSGVEKFLDTPVKRYSSGMYVRLAFAVAAHLEPEILIVDEVLAVGDAEFQRKCLGKMKAVSRESGRTVLFVSHNMSAVVQLCQTGILLRKGTVSHIGSAREAVEEYLTDAKVACDGEFDLRDHPARSNNHKPLIQKLALRDDSGRLTDAFDPRGGITVDIHILAERPIREPRIALAVEDAFEHRITTVANYFERADLGPIAGEAVVRCRIDHLNLGSGRYLLSASIGEKTTGLLDSVDGAARFGVIWNNSYGNGEDHLPVFGPVLTRSHWEMSKQ